MPRFKVYYNDNGKQGFRYVNNQASADDAVKELREYFQEWPPTKHIEVTHAVITSEYDGIEHLKP